MLTRRAVAGLLSLGVAHPAHGFELAPLRVQFRADVTRESCVQLEEAVDARVAQRRTLMRHLRGAIASDVELPPPPIHLHVTSGGGSLLSALYMYDYLSEVPALHTHAEGLVASAATLLTVVGAHRTMTKHSMMLVHQPSVAAAERELKFADARDEFLNLQKCTTALLGIYNATTTMEYADLVSLVQNEQFLTARECLQYGFIDEIV